MLGRKMSSFRWQDADQPVHRESQFITGWRKAVYGKSLREPAEVLLKADPKWQKRYVSL